ncbi:MAG: hypothetical protein FWD60_13300 [Candidatus Azobacteroides sp.]|nr:hypothetical protein [Candidatus Azobacteroides sp.]
MKRLFYLFPALLLTCLNPLQAQENNRWHLAGDGGIVWTIDSRIPHNDHIEMSGKQLSVILRYGIDDKQSFIRNLVLVNGMSIDDEQVDSIALKVKGIELVYIKL